MLVVAMAPGLTKEFISGPPSSFWAASTATIELKGMPVASTQPRVHSGDRTLPRIEYSGVMMPCAALKIQNMGSMFLELVRRCQKDSLLIGGANKLFFASHSSTRASTHYGPEETHGRLRSPVQYRAVEVPCVSEALRGTSRVTARAGSLPRKALVVLQIAFSLGLLSVSGLLTSALHALETQDFGFEQDRRIVENINPRLAGYRPVQLSQLYRRIHDSIAGIPGVSSVALCLYSPPDGGWGSGVWIDGRPAPGPREDNSSSWDRVTDRYFDVIATPIVKGRGFPEQDTAASRHVAIINQAFARKFFKNEDPIGKHFGQTPGNSREFEVVDVVKDARYYTRGLDQPAASAGGR
jgi:hypothetical protein